MRVEELKSAFFETYGKPAEAVYFAPGRVNLIGEHVDYNGGSVLPCALSLGTYLVLARNADSVMNFKSLNQPEIQSLKLNELSKALDKSWVNYPLGVLAQFLKQGLFIHEGFDILFWGNVPHGSGLSSSASLELATAFAFNDQLSTGFSRTKLAQLSQAAEHEFAGVNCGIMDQFASAHGARDMAIHLNCNTLDFQLVPMKMAGVKILISNTHSPHKLDSGAYNQRVAECKLAISQLKAVRPICYLAELTPGEFDKYSYVITDEKAFKRARHVVGEVQRTSEAIQALNRGDIYRFGQLMNASHISLRDDYEVTGPELDCMVEAAWKQEGVIGSRMTGGGFGGCTVSLVQEDAIEHYIQRVGPMYESCTHIHPEFYIAEIGNGACRLA